MCNVVIQGEDVRTHVINVVVQGAKTTYGVSLMLCSALLCLNVTISTCSREEMKGGGDVCKLGEGAQSLIESRGRLEARRRT